MFAIWRKSVGTLANRAPSHYDPIPARDSFRDLLLWMYDTGKLDRADIGRLADERQDMAPPASMTDLQK